MNKHTSATDGLPNGFIPLQFENGAAVYAACMDANARHYKWLMWKHPDGQWVSKRKLEDWEVMQCALERIAHNPMSRSEELGDVAMRNIARQALTAVVEQPAQPGTVKMPTSIKEAEAMEKIGYAYLQQHAPERLTAQQKPVAIVDANDDGYWGEILPDRSVKVGQFLYTRPQAREPEQQEPEQQEPVYLVWMKAHCAWMHTDKEGFDKTDEENRWMLYTRPQAREPEQPAQQIAEWAERHGIKGVITDLRCAFDDAQTLIQPEHQEPYGYVHELWVDGQLAGFSSVLKTKTHLDTVFGVAGVEHGGTVREIPLYTRPQARKPLHIGEEAAAFKAWFDAWWVGDGDICKAVTNEVEQTSSYKSQYTLAFGAWMAAKEAAHGTEGNA